MNLFFVIACALMLGIYLGRTFLSEVPNEYLGPVTMVIGLASFINFLAPSKKQVSSR